MDDEDFLAAVEADNTNAPAEEPRPEPEPAKVEAPQEPEPSAPAEPAPVEPAPEPAPAVAADPKQHEAGYVPLAVVLDTRDKLKAAEAELAHFRAQQAQQQVQMPDPYEDPEGFAQVQEARVQQAILNQTLNTSERFARKEYGVETVESAKAWALQRYAQDPFYQQQVLRDPDPYERVVTDFRREQVFAKVQDPSDFDAFLAWKAAQGQLQQQQAAPAASPNNAPSIPPRSLASAPSAGSVLSEPAIGEEEIFEAGVGKR